MSRTRSGLHSLDDFIAQAKAKHQVGRFEYTRSVFAGVASYITITCLTHGDFSTLAYWHLRKDGGCQQCRLDSRKTTVGDYLASITNAYDVTFDYSTLTGQFVTATERITVSCPLHGPFEVHSAAHREGRAGCPDCNHGSRHEREVGLLLEAAGLVFKRQWSHPTLRHKGPLRYDFMIAATATLIEYDGAFHFKAIRMAGQSAEQAADVLAESKVRDAIKDRWAAANGWTLVRLHRPHRIRADLVAAGVLP